MSLGPPFFYPRVTRRILSCNLLKKLFVLPQPALQPDECRHYVRSILNEELPRDVIYKSSAHAD